jgi:hypothetical protein
MSEHVVVKGMDMYRHPMEVEGVPYWDYAVTTIGNDLERGLYNRRAAYRGILGVYEMFAEVMPEDARLKVLDYANELASELPVDEAQADWTAMQEKLGNE